MNTPLTKPGNLTGGNSEDQQLASFVDQYRTLFVLTGAGCSTASGLGDYRDDKGQWKRQQPITGQTFTGNETARKRYWARSAVGWPLFSRARPNAAHNALATLQKIGVSRHLVTQNVDGLHQKAGHANVIDLHGALETVSCINCRKRLDRQIFQRALIESNPWLEELSAAHAPDGDADLEHAAVADLSVPDCAHCQGLLKPDVVFFGENVPRTRVDLAIRQLSECDALLVVGSSLMVYSGYRFCRSAIEHGQPVAIINNGHTRADDLASLKVSGDCGQRLTNLAHNLSR